MTCVLIIVYNNSFIIIFLQFWSRKVTYPIRCNKLNSTSNYLPATTTFNHVNTQKQKTTHVK